MTQHVFWIVKCPECKTPQPLKYIGEDDGRPVHFLPSEVPEFTFPCSGCGKTHYYSRQDFELGKMDHPPGPEWVDAF